MFMNFWNYAASIVMTNKSVTNRFCTFVTVIMQIRIFSLNLLNSNENFKTTKYSLERSLQKEQEYPKKKKIFFPKFFRKTLGYNLKEFFNGNLKLLSLTLQRAMFDQDISLVLNHILYWFKRFIYISRDSNIPLFWKF